MTVRKDYLEVRVPGTNKLVGEWYPTHVMENDRLGEVRGGELILRGKCAKDLALPAVVDLYSGSFPVTNGQIFSIVDGAVRLMYLQIVGVYAVEKKGRDRLFSGVTAIVPDNLDVLNAVHLAKALQGDHNA